MFEEAEEDGFEPVSYEDIREDNEVFSVESLSDQDEEMEELDYNPIVHVNEYANFPEITQEEMTNLMKACIENQMEIDWDAIELDCKEVSTKPLRYVRYPMKTLKYLTTQSHLTQRLALIQLSNDN